MKTHIDFFPSSISERMRSRFKISDNMFCIPERHKAIFKNGLTRVKSLNDNQFIIVAFYQEDVPLPVFKYITKEQFKNLYNDINWCDNQGREL